MRVRERAGRLRAWIGGLPTVNGGRGVSIIAHNGNAARLGGLVWAGAAGGPAERPQQAGTVPPGRLFPFLFRPVCPCPLLPVSAAFLLVLGVLSCCPSSRLSSVLSCLLYFGMVYLTAQTRIARRGRSRARGSAGRAGPRGAWYAGLDKKKRRRAPGLLSPVLGVVRRAGVVRLSAGVLVWPPAASGCRAAFLHRPDPLCNGGLADGQEGGNFALRVAVGQRFNDRAVGVVVGAGVQISEEDRR